jgi:UDP-N-acetylmuramate--alanine ligase
MLKKKKIHVHFMGIGGSALAGVAILAKKYGFEVSGCDLAKETAYSHTLAKSGIKYFIGHDVNHLKNVDILAVSPAVLFTTPLHPEIKEAKKQGFLMTWQEFLGGFLQKGKTVIAIAGTHGKSTITAMIGLMMEQGGLDPTVEVGAIVPQWEATVRFGRSKYFVCEADEFNNNFLNYSPGIIIINNLEMDHPEFFRDFNHFLSSFAEFIQKIKKPKILIINKEDKGSQKLLAKMEPWLNKEKVKVVDFYRGEVFNLSVPGVHNEFNVRAAIACGKELKINFNKIKNALANFKGISRRFDLIGEKEGIKIYEDYAVHPTAVEATLKAARQKYPKQKIWAVFEPHQYSRLKLFSDNFAKVLKLADEIIITAIYPGREKINPVVKAEDLARKIGNKAEYIEDFGKVAEKIKAKAQKGNVVIVFGAGKSYQLARQILEQLNG